MASYSEHIEAAAAKLQDWSQRLDGLEAQVEQAPEAERAELSATIASLRQRRAELQAKVTDARRAGGAAWDEVAAGFGRANATMAEAFERARARLDRTASPPGAAAASGPAGAAG